MDDQSKVFLPPRGRGLLFNLGMIVSLGLFSAALLSFAFQTSLGPLFLVYLLGALFIAVPIPLLAYRAYSLLRGQYQVDRNGIRLKWGFREEDIPLDKIRWVELAEDLIVPLKFPRVTWPGAVVGIAQQEGLGLLEFLSAEKQELIMIGAPERVLVISPGNAKAFLRAYQVANELGSLSPIPAYSTYPQFPLFDIWRIRTTRILLILTLVMSLALFVLVGWSIPTHPQVSLGFDALKVPLPPVSSGQLFLIPAINILLLTASYLISLFFFRRQQNHPLVYVIWISNTLTAFLFLLAVYFILRTG